MLCRPHLNIENSAHADRREKWNDRSNMAKISLQNNTAVKVLQIFFYQKIKLVTKIMHMYVDIMIYE